MTPLAWCIILLAAAIGFIFLEMFIPSGGVLTGLSFISVGVAVALAYWFHGMGIGTAVLAIAAVVMPLSVMLAVRWYPQTPLGKLLLAEPPTAEEVIPEEVDARKRAHLKGMVGKAKTTMLPGGTVNIDGANHDAVSEAGVIEAGDIVLVVRVESTHLIVRKADGEVLKEQVEAGAAAESGDLLSQPIESFGFESLDDPLS